LTCQVFSYTTRNGHLNLSIMPVGLEAEVELSGVKMGK
jgi:hypothetical protein